MRRLAPVVVILSLLSVLGCGETKTEAKTAEAGQSAARIKIKAGDGSTAFKLKGKEDGAKIVDAAENELYRFKWKKGKVKIKDPADKVLGYVSAKDPKKVLIKDPKLETVFFVLRAQDDGDWKLEDGKEALICKIKKRDYGWTIRDAADKDLYKIKVADGKTSLRDAADKTRYSTKDKVRSLAFAALGLDMLSADQKLALLFKLDEMGD